MRLHRMELEGFGPFVAPAEIDFDALGDAGVFLVHGPTGAGKTSILDAICYALYSDLPGSRSARGVRSDLQTPEALTRVSLEFTCADRRLRVTRSPEFDRPKKRGSGMVRQPARVVLEEWIGAAWVCRSTRIEESADALRETLGMGLAQFQRVALLPQGEFAGFLRAEPKERHALLTALFDVTGFEDAEDWLAQERRRLAAAAGEAARELAYHERALTDLLAALPTPLPMPEPQDDKGHQSRVGHEDAGPAHWEAWGAGVREQVQQLGSSATAAHELAQLEEAKAVLAHQQARDLLGLRRRAAVAQERMARCEEVATQMDRDRERHRRALAAAPLRGHLTALRRAEEADAMAQEACERAAERLTALGAAEGDAAQLVRILEEQRHPLDDLAARAGAAARADAEVSRREVALARAGGLLDAAQEALQAQAAELTAARSAAQEFTQCDHAIPQARHRVRAWEAVRAGIAALDAAEEELTRMAQDHLRAREADVSARERLVSLHQDRIDHLAAELSAGLRTGDACPVCGSVEHPAPAAAGAAWDPELLIRAQEVADEAAGTLLSVNTRLGHARGARDHLAQTLGDSLREAEKAHSEEEAAPGTSQEPAWPMPDQHRAAVAQALDVAKSQLDELLARLAALSDAPARLRSATSAAETTDAALTSARTQLETAGEEFAAAQEWARGTTRDVNAALTAHRHCPCQPHRYAEAPPPVDAPMDGTEPEQWLGWDTTNRGPGSARPDPTDVAARVVARHRRVAEAATALAEAQHTLAERGREAARCRAETAQALTDQGFASVADAEAANLAPEALTEVEARLAGHDRERALATATLAEPEIFAALEEPAPPDEGAAARRVAQARAAVLATARERNQVERIAEALDAQLAQVLAGAVTAAELDAQHRQVAALADLVAGTSPQNSYKMRLSTYVLAARLERVVELANERLRRMGDGRFQLEHDDALAARGARSGLGLRVRDEWSGRSRETGSLSGGESFLASLALALGLADTLRESSGGVEMQSLFVDEGFGALDETSLEEVLDLLDTLRDGGRSVGVISHVPQLRSRILAQLTVTKDAAGSTIEQSSQTPAA